MGMTPQQLIVSRVLRELAGAGRVGLGQGIPQLLAAHVGDSIEIVDVAINGQPLVDLSVVEAGQVSRSGGLLLAHPEDAALLSARRCLVATRQCDENGDPRLVDQCSRPTDCQGCVDMVVTELGVIVLNDVGFELRELAPGVASDDVRARVNASLHVSDSIQNMVL